LFKVYSNRTPSGTVIYDIYTVYTLYTLYTVYTLVEIITYTQITQRGHRLRAVYRGAHGEKRPLESDFMVEKLCRTVQMSSISGRDHCKNISDPEWFMRL